MDLNAHRVKSAADGEGQWGSLHLTSLTNHNQDQARWRILVVEDEPRQQLIMTRLLMRAGYDVKTANNGKDALSKINDSDFQLMITDWEMPEMDGIALCSKMRSMSVRAYIYTILLTSRDAIEHVVTGLQAGADDYLTKPVLEPELIARLNTGKRIVALERSLRTANEENRRLSITDALTGTFNRRYLMEQLPREIQRAKRLNYPLAVLICDIDHFKDVNDKYGHAAGGDVLFAVASILRQGVEAERGWVAHHGGDEFAIVLPHSGLSVATGVAERLRVALKNETIRIGSAEIQVTASFGVSGRDRIVPRAAGMEDFLRPADDGVYESKSKGRNQVSIKELSHFNTRA